MDGILDLDGFDANLAEDLMFLTPFTANATDEATQKFVADYKMHLEAHQFSSQQMLMIVYM